MKILVTGAAGFIGGQLWHTLWKRGDEVVGIDNFSYGNPDNLKFDDHDFGAEVRRMDIRDKAGMLALFEAEKFDVVYNIAGIAPLLRSSPCSLSSRRSTPSCPTRSSPSPSAPAWTRLWPHSPQPLPRKRMTAITLTTCSAS